VVDALVPVQVEGHEHSSSEEITSLHPCQHQAIPGVFVALVFQDFHQFIVFLHLFQQAGMLFAD
jgi:hypothetical protein